MIKKNKKIKIASLALAVMTLFAVFFPTAPSRSAKAENLTSLSFDFRNMEGQMMTRYIVGQSSSVYWYPFVSANLTISSEILSVDIMPCVFIEDDFYYNGVGSSRIKNINLSSVSSGTVHDSIDLGSYSGDTAHTVFPYIVDYSFKDFNLSTLAFTMYRIVYTPYADSAFYSIYPYASTYISQLSLYTVTYEYYFSDSVLDNYFNLTFITFNIDYSTDSSLIGYSKKSTPLRYVQSLTSLDLQSAYDSGYADGKKDYDGSGYQKGYNDGVNSAQNNTFLTLLDAVFYAPVKAVVSLFDFDLLGFNMLSFVKAIFTLIVLLSIVHLIL